MINDDLAIKLQNKKKSTFIELSLNHNTFIFGIR